MPALHPAVVEAKASEDEQQAKHKEPDKNLIRVSHSRFFGCKQRDLYVCANVSQGLNPLCQA